MKTQTGAVTCCRNHRPYCDLWFPICEMKNMKNLFSLLAAALLLQACSNPTSTPIAAEKDSIQVKDTTIRKPAATGQPLADAATILQRKQVPVLCYHDIKDWKANERQSMKEYIVPVEAFKAQMQSLADSGYQTITPGQYFDYLTTGAPLPPKPIIISFDDGDAEQFTVGATELAKHNFKGVFFVMTIAIGKKRYMSSEQIKQLADAGHIIASHTWDHHKVKGYTAEDYDVQFGGSKQKLESITGKPVEYFAYPFGIWDTAALPQLQQRGYKGAFQLSASRRDSTLPLYTLRRMIVPGTWNTATMHKWIKINFR